MVRSGSICGSAYCVVVDFGGPAWESDVVVFLFRSYVSTPFLEGETAFNVLVTLSRRITIRLLKRYRTVVLDRCLRVLSITPGQFVHQGK